MTWLLGFFWFAVTMAMLLPSALFIYESIRCLIPIRGKWRYRIFLLIGCALLSGMIIYMGDLANLPPTFLFFLAGMWISCEGSGYKRITIGLMLASVMFAFNGLHDNLLAYWLDRFTGSTMNGVVRTLFSLMLYLWIRSHKPSEQTFELEPSLWRLLLVLTLMPLGTVLSLILLRRGFYDKLNPSTSLSDTSLLLLAVLSFAGLLWAMLVLERQQRLEWEHALAQHNQVYYETMEQQQFEIRRLKHDLSNHLQVLAALPEEKRTSYIEEMLKGPALSQVLTYSGDAAVNAVLTAKESLMRQRDIVFLAEVEIPAELPFDKVDICALFANALDNAVEACALLPKEERKISLVARSRKGMLAVHVRNPCVARPVADHVTDHRMGKEMILQTTKADMGNHGFGLRSIREVVKKYGGNMEIGQKEGEFELFLYLLFPIV